MRAVAVLLVCLAILSWRAEARSYYAARIPNGGSVPTPDGSGICQGFGHESCFGGGARNQFGLDFEANGYEWTEALCMLDSDGDGLTNGQELGDPCCEWTEEAEPHFSESLSHPGFESSVANIELVDCSAPNDGSSGSETVFFIESETQLKQVMTFDYVVQPVDTEYINFPFNFQVNGSDSPTETPLYLVGWEVAIDHYEHVHHFVGYLCLKEQFQEPMMEPFDEETGLRNSLDCDKLSVVWAPGEHTFIFPQNVALPVGPGTQHLAIIIQVHYDNPTLISGVQDVSNLTLHYTDKPREHDMAILGLGDQILSWNNEIPAGEESWAVSSRCLIQLNQGEEINVFAHLPHMHWNGIRLWSETIAKGGIKNDDGRWNFDAQAQAGGEPLEVLGRNDFYDADFQKIYVPEGGVKLKTGDLLSTTCVFSTADKTEPVTGGLGSRQEMCIHYVMYYPAEALTNLNCNAQDPSVAGPWPSELSSVVKVPDTLGAFLTPNPSIGLGYDSTLDPFAGCDWAAIMSACSVTDFSDESQWSPVKLCDFTGDCAPLYGASCEGLASIQAATCQAPSGPASGECDLAAVRLACGFDPRLTTKWDLDLLCPSSGSACAEMATTCPEFAEGIAGACYLKESLTPNCQPAASQLVPLLTPLALTSADSGLMADGICTAACTAEVAAILGTDVSASVATACCGVQWLNSGCTSAAQPDLSTVSGVLLEPVEFSCSAMEAFGTSSAPSTGVCSYLSEDTTCAGLWPSWTGALQDPGFAAVCGSLKCSTKLLNSCANQAVLDYAIQFLSEQPADLASTLWAFQQLDVSKMDPAAYCPLVTTPDCLASVQACPEIAYVAAQTSSLEFVEACFSDEPEQPGDIDEDDWGCDWMAIMASCEVTDVEDESQWTQEKICDMSSLCAPVLKSGCGGFQAVQMSTCGGSPADIIGDDDDGPTAGDDDNGGAKTAGDDDDGGANPAGDDDDEGANTAGDNDDGGAKTAGDDDDGGANTAGDDDDKSANTAGDEDDDDTKTDTTAQLAPEDEVLVVYATMEFSDLSINEFTTALGNQLRSDLASAASVGVDRVAILGVRSGSVVVDWNVAFDASEPSKSQAFEDKLVEAPAGVVSAMFGAMQVTDMVKSTQTYAQFLAVAETEETDNSSARYVQLSLLATVAAVVAPLLHRI